LYTAATLAGQNLNLRIYRRKSYSTVQHDHHSVISDSVFSVDFLKNLLQVYGKNKDIRQVINKTA